jgi:hypothetical protein
MNRSITDKSAGLDGSILSMFVHSRVVPVVVRTHLDTAWRQFGTSQMDLTETFRGYYCTDECVSHAAGYRWAKECEIQNINDCPKNRSEAFYEGCLTYVDDPERGADFDGHGKEIVSPTPTSY